MCSITIIIVVIVKSMSPGKFKELKQVKFKEIVTNWEMYTFRLLQ